MKSTKVLPASTKNSPQDSPTVAKNSAVLVHPVKLSGGNTEIDLDADDEEQLQEQLRRLSAVKSWSLPGSESHGKFAFFVTGQNYQVWVIEDNEVMGMYGHCKPKDDLAIMLQPQDSQDEGRVTVAYTVNGTVRYISKPKELKEFKPLGAFCVIGGGKSTGIAKFRWEVPLVKVKDGSELQRPKDAPFLQFSTRAGAIIRQQRGNVGAIVARKMNGNSKMARVQSKQSHVMAPHGSGKATGIRFSPQSCNVGDEIAVLIGLTYFPSCHVGGIVLPVLATGAAAKASGSVVEVVNKIDKKEKKLLILKSFFICLCICLVLTLGVVSLFLIPSSPSSPSSPLGPSADNLEEPTIGSVGDTSDVQDEASTVTDTTRGSSADDSSSTDSTTSTTSSGTGTDLIGSGDSSGDGGTGTDSIGSGDSSGDGGTGTDSIGGGDSSGGGGSGGAGVTGGTTCTNGPNGEPCATTGSVSGTTTSVNGCTCTCDAGYEGTHCADKILCTAGPLARSCGSHGSPHGFVVDAAGCTCACSNSNEWAGDHCEIDLIKQDAIAALSTHLKVRLLEFLDASDSTLVLDACETNAHTYYVANDEPRNLFLHHLKGAFDGIQQLSTDSKKQQAWKQVAKSSVEMIALHTIGADMWPMQDTMADVAFSLGVGNTGISSKVSYQAGIVDVVSSGMIQLGTKPTLLALVNSNDVGALQSSVQALQGLHGLLMSVFLDFFLRGTLHSSSASITSVSSGAGAGSEVDQVTEYVGLAVQTAVVSLNSTLAGRFTESMSTTPVIIEDYVERITVGAVRGSFNISSTHHVVTSIQFSKLSQVVSRSLVTGVSEMTIYSASVTGTVELSQIVARSVKTCCHQQQELVLSACTSSDCSTRSELLLSSAHGIIESISNMPPSTLAVSEIKTMVMSITNSQVHALSKVTSLVDSPASKDALVDLLRELLAQIMSLLSLLVTSTTNANVDATLISTEIIEGLLSGFSHGVSSFLLVGSSGLSASQIQTVVTNGAKSTVAGITAMRVSGGFNGGSATLNTGQVSTAIQRASSTWVSSLPTLVASSSTTKVATVKTLMTSFTSGSMDSIIALPAAQQGTNTELKLVIGAVSRGTIDGAGVMLANDATTYQYFDLDVMISSTQQAIQPLMTRTIELSAARSSGGGAWVAADSAAVVRQVTQGVVTSVSAMPSSTRLSTAAQVKTILTKVPLPAMVACYGTFSVESRSTIVGFAVKSFVEDVEVVQARSTLVSLSVDLTGLTGSAVSEACTALPIDILNATEVQGALSQVYASALEGAEGSTIDDLAKTSTDLGAGFEVVVNVIGQDDPAGMTRAAAGGLSSGLALTTTVELSSLVATLVQTLKALTAALSSSTALASSTTDLIDVAQVLTEEASIAAEKLISSSSTRVAGGAAVADANAIRSSAETGLNDQMTTNGNSNAFGGSCGDGTRQVGEECDDGNVHDGDGCTSACRTAAPEKCGTRKCIATQTWKGTTPGPNVPCAQLVENYRTTVVSLNPNELAAQTLFTDFTTRGMKFYNSNNMNNNEAKAFASDVQAKFGDKAYYFDGSFSRISLTHMTQWRYTTAFTIEFWARFDDVSTGTQYLYSQGTSDFVFGVFDGKLTLKLGITTVMEPFGFIVAETWNHYALVSVIDADQSATEYQGQRTYTIYKDGAELAVSTNDQGNAGAVGSFQPLTIGAKGTSEYALGGYLDEIRISTVARYSTDFVPRVTEFSADENTLLLLHANDKAGCQFLKTFLESSVALNANAPPLLWGTGAFTIEAWVYPTGSHYDNYFPDAGQVYSTGEHTFSLNLWKSRAVMCSFLQHNAINWDGQFYHENTYSVVTPDWSVHRFQWNHVGCFRTTANEISIVLNGKIYNQEDAKANGARCDGSNADDDDQLGASPCADGLKFRTFGNGHAMNLNPYNIPTAPRPVIGATTENYCQSTGGVACQYNTNPDQGGTTYRGGNMQGMVRSLRIIQGQAIYDRSKQTYEVPEFLGNCTDGTAEGVDCFALEHGAPGPPFSNDDRAMCTSDEKCVCFGGFEGDNCQYTVMSNWSPLNPLAPEVYPGWTKHNLWNSIATSGNGRSVMVGTSGWHSFLTKNAGDTWQNIVSGSTDVVYPNSISMPHTGNGKEAYTAISMSENGSVMWACIGYENNNLYTSSDGGDTWQEINTLLPIVPKRVAVSGNGQTVIWSPSNQPQIVVSMDAGATFVRAGSEYFPGMGRAPSSVSVSDDGLKMVFVADDLEGTETSTRMYYAYAGDSDGNKPDPWSTNYVFSFTFNRLSTPHTNGEQLYGVHLTGDGTKLIVAARFAMYYSHDYANGFSTGLTKAADWGAYEVSCSNDGALCMASKLVTAASHGVYYSNDGGQTWQQYASTVGLDTSSDDSWGPSAVSGDGKRAYAAMYSGDVYAFDADYTGSAAFG